MNWSALLSGLVGRRRHVSDVYHELIPVSRKYAHGQPHGSASMVERRPEYLEDPDAAILTQAEFVVQVLNRAVFNIRSLDELCGALQDKAHRIEGCLQGPWKVIDIAPLVPADDRGTLGDLEGERDAAGRLLDLDLRIGAADVSRLPLRGLTVGILAVYRGDIAPWRCLGVGVQGSDERVDLPYHEGALTWAALDEPERSEPLDRITDRVA